MAESGLKTFWSELRRRKVVKAAIVYVVVAWLLIQIAEVIFEPLKLPDWSLTLVIVLAALGFPLALVLAWAFEMSPEGLQRDRAQVPDRKASPEETSEDEKSTTASARIRKDERRAIAVLPLANMSGDPENEFFSDGITEEILNLLAKQPELRVVSRTSSFSFKNTTLDVPAIARKLGVDIVLEGSVRRAGNRVRIVAQLIDAANDAHLWSDSYDRELEDIFAVQTDIAKRIVDAMNLDPDACVECGGNTNDINAYDYYLRGRQYFHQVTATGFRFAREMFHKAIDADPGFARAYAGLANLESFTAQWIDPTPDPLEAADTASRKALELAPDLPEAHSARGFALSVNGSFDAAAEEFEKALQLDPMNYESLYLYGRTRFAEGNLEHAAELWKRAHESQPDEFQSAALRTQVLFSLGRDEEARESNRVALEAVDRRLALNPDDVRALMLGGCLAHYAGREEDGRAMTERALGLAPDDAGVLHNATCYYSNIGDVDRAIEIFERRIALSRTLYREWVDHDADFDNIRDHPRFIELLEILPRRSHEPRDD